jgi:RNA polymerase sigma factor (sigma-70 family)
MAEAIAYPVERRRSWLPALTDPQLARAAARGEERAFAAIYRRYQERLFRYCVTIVGSPEDARDALQNAMAKALAAFQRGEAVTHLKPWLYRIAHNESIELIRRRREEAPLEEADGVSDLTIQPAFEGRARLRELVSDLRELPDRQRGALVMRELGDLSAEEIGAVLGTTPAAAKQAIYEARVSLQQIAEGRMMDCAEARQAISDRDGRALRGRRLRSHLRGCSGCADFECAISVRRADLHAIPALPAAAATALLGGLLGGGKGGGGAGLMAASGVFSTTAAKIAAVTAISAGVGLGTLEAGNTSGEATAERPGATKVTERERSSGGETAGRERTDVARGDRRKNSAGSDPHPGGSDPQGAGRNPAQTTPASTPEGHPQATASVTQPSASPPTSPPVTPPSSETRPTTGAHTGLNQASQQTSSIPPQAAIALDPATAPQSALENVPVSPTSPGASANGHERPLGRGPLQP